MSSSATDTEGQITISKCTENVCARRINGDVGALQIGRTVSRFNALAAPCAPLPGAHLCNGGNYLALIKSAMHASINLGVNAGRLYQYQRASVCAVSGYGANYPAAGWDGVGVEPPITAEIDGKAATIGMCHGRRSLLLQCADACDASLDCLQGIFADVFRSGEGSAKYIYGAWLILFELVVGGCGYVTQLSGNIFFPFGGGVVNGGDVFFVAGDDFGSSHFIISPTPDYPRRGRFALMHPMSCIIHTKQKYASGFCNLFSGRETCHG